MNISYYLPVLVVVVSNLIYHNLMKNQPQNFTVFLSLTVAYLVSAILTITIFFMNNGNIKTDFSAVNWMSCLLGVAIVGIELGYLLMYKNGWNISMGALTANTCAALLLLLIGLSFYKENISIHQIVGVVLCITGLILTKV